MHLLTRDYWLKTEHGRLYAKRWSPPSNQRHGNAPIVLFHDSLGCVALWRDFSEQLARATGKDVIAYDRLGFGQSEPNPATLTHQFVHEETNTSFRTLREQLDFDNFIAFGHSVGGGMAIACAAAYANECNAVIIESAQVFTEPHTLDGIRQAKQLFEQPGQLERLQKYHGDKAAWVLNAWTNTWLAPDFADWNLNAELQQIRCPVLAIYGDQDEYSSLNHPERIRLLTGERTTVEIMETVGHVPHREKGETVVSLVADWLNALAANSSAS